MLPLASIAVGPNATSDCAIFPESRLTATLREMREASLQESIDATVKTLGSWAGDAGFADDVSLLGVEWKAAAQA